MTPLYAEGAASGERAIRQFELINLALAVLTVVIVHVLAGWGPFLWGAFVGGLVGVLNLRAMVFIGRRIMRAQQRSRVAWGVLFMFKLVLLCTVVWLCLSLLPLNSIGFLVGMSTVLPSTLVLTAVRALERAPTPQPVGGQAGAARPSANPHGERRL